jgi:Suppressor of fused protein (SUFU)
MISKQEEDEDERLASDWYDRKSALMAEVLGEEHDMVMHAMIPYYLDGSLDLYYFPNGVAGTGIATKELSDLPGEGSTNDVFDNYELVMFTRQPIALDDAQDESTPFGRAHQSISAILNCIARYSAEAILNPHETCEFPEDMEVVGGRCLIFDAYGCDDDHAEFGLLTILEVHRSEMDYAREQGGRQLIEKLKAAGYYPYSDLDRPAVV